MSTGDDGSYSSPPGGAGDQDLDPTYEEPETLEEEEEPTEDGEET